MTPAATVTPVDLAELTLTVTRRGQGPAVVLLHGFPEIAYSWRHQISALAEAGYEVFAPDLRGFGWSDQPEGIEAYAMHEYVGDVIGLLDYHGIDDAVIVGHDIGSMIAARVALYRPDRVRALALLSVPYVPRGDRSIVDGITADDPDGDFAYIVGFQDEGVEELFEANPLEALRRMFWTLSGALPEAWERGDPVPKGLPAHLTQGEFENYYRAFARSGFGKPISFFRNLRTDWRAERPWHNAKLGCPVIFIAGDKDFVVTTSDGALGSTVNAMNDNCTDLRSVHLLAGAGHWVQQEAPDQVNELLLDFLRSLNS